MPTENRSSNTGMVSDLLPCPFCGEKPQITKHHREDIYSFMHRCQVLGPISWGFREDQQAHIEKWNARAQPAPQPHPEPIAWMVGTAIWWTKEEAERDAANTGLPIVGLGPMSCAAPAGQHQGEPVAWRGLNELGEIVTEWVDGVPPSSMVDLCGNPASFARIEQAYTHAEPSEVEDLLASTSLEFGERLGAVEKERDALCSQLAERDALLREADEFMYIMTGHDSHARLSHQYGEKWWDAIDKLRGKVCTVLSAEQRRR